MVTKAHIDQHLNALLDEFQLDNDVQKKLYYSKIAPLVTQEIFAGLEIIQFTSEQECDEFFQRFKKAHREAVFKSINHIKSSLKKLEKGEESSHHLENIENKVNSYLNNVRAIAQQEAATQVRSCAESVSAVLSIFDKKISDPRWNSVDKEFQKELAMYRKNLNDVNQKVSKLLQYNIHEEPRLSEFKVCYEQALDLMYSCRQRIHEQAQKYKESNEPTTAKSSQKKTLIGQLQAIISMLFARLRALFSKKATQKYSAENIESNEVIAFSRAKTPASSTALQKRIGD